jgi:hypothetical protein
MIESPGYNDSLADFSASEDSDMVFLDEGSSAWFWLRDFPRRPSNSGDRRELACVVLGPYGAVGHFSFDMDVNIRGKWAGRTSISFRLGRLVFARRRSRACGRNR